MAKNDIKKICRICGLVADEAEFKKSDGCPRCNAPLCMITDAVKTSVQD